MRKIMKGTFLLILVGILLYGLDERYNLLDWVTQMSESEKHNNPEDFVKRVQLAMLGGTEHITLTYIGKVEKLQWFTDEAIEKAFNIDASETSSDYDYLRFNIKSISAKITGFGNILMVTYDFTYNETVTETEQVDKKVKQILKNLNIDKLSDYQKIKKIHNYIIKNASYDSSLTNYTAFDNLIEKSSTCQGYMILAYKMFTEAGIPCRIISGTGKEQSHGWNIAQLNDKWYNLDCTWDDPVTWNGEEVLRYNYFLKSDQDFKDHIRDAKYRSKKFYQKYKMSTESYKKTSNKY